MVEFARLRGEVMTLDECSDAVVSPEAGAVVTFAGIVRDHDGGRSVSRLEYEAHPSAADRMMSVAASIAATYPGVRIAIEHRVGTLEVGDLALACAVASAHRGEAFEACAKLVDGVKLGVPIWKKQYFVDGETEWVGSV